jgi:hypothetical protein
MTDIAKSAYTGTGTERRLVDIFRHEAGHMMIARLFGLDTGKPTLAAAFASAEVTLDPDLPNMGAAISYIERRIIILCAGAMAESLRTMKSIISSF